MHEGSNRNERLDSLFSNAGAQPSKIKKKDEPVSNAVINISRLIPFKNHPFRPYTGERLDDMVESIKKNGIIVPVLVRKASRKFEILSGHNRVEAAKIAGLTEVPITILTNVSDEEAMLYVVETNLMQRSFSDMVHSEKAAIVALHHAEIFSQGKRISIISELQDLASVGFSQKLHSREIIADQYSLSPSKVAQYIRMDKLHETLKQRLDNGEFPLSVAVTISFLKEVQQIQLDKSLTFGATLDMRMAEQLKRFSESGLLNANSMHGILYQGLGKRKPNRTPTVKVRKDIYSQYFDKNQSNTEIQSIVEAAIIQYFDK